MITGTPRRELGGLPKGSYFFAPTYFEVTEKDEKKMTTQCTRQMLPSSLTRLLRLA